MGMAKKEYFNGSPLRAGSSTGGDDYGDRSESFWQSKRPSFLHEFND